MRIASILLVGCLAAGIPLGAQGLETPPDVRLRLGPLALEPTLAIRNLGIDTNALNASNEPRRDVTATITPELREWLRLGRAVFSGTSSIDWNYFQKLTTERSFNGAQEARLDLSLGYLQPYALGAAARTRQRPNLEIDTRIERTTTLVGGGVIVSAGPKLWFDLSQQRRRIDFGREQVGESALADALNRDERETRLTGRYALTPLTTLLVTAAHRQDRFSRATVRDTDTIVGMAGFEFKPLALMSGRASIGWRRFTPVSSTLPVFRGLVSDVEVAYQIRDVTRLTVAVVRDLDYSFELSEPYYVSTETRANLVQALGTAWDIVGRVGHTSLDYRRMTGGPADTRVDAVLIVGGGIGRRLGSDVRIGFDVDRAERRSTMAGRDYDAVRLGGSVTYGF